MKGRMERKKRGKLAGLLAVVCSAAMALGGMPILHDTVYAEENEWAVAERELTVDKVFVGDSIQVEEAPVVEFKGVMTDEEDFYEYFYTAERGGRYRFDLADVRQDCEVALYIYDSLGNTVGYGRIPNGSTENLTAGETYTLQVKRESGNTDFTLRIKPQKDTIDITNITEIKDQIMFDDQKNCYKYTAPYNGYYRFYITDRTANAKYKLLMWDQYGTNIVEEVIDNYGNGSTIELQGGITYDIQMRQYEGIGQYTLKVMAQKPSIDIAGYTKISDKIEYDGQRIYYTFTAPESGTYSIQKTEQSPNNTLGFAMWDGVEELFNHTGTLYMAGVSYEKKLTLEKGKTYDLLVMDARQGMGDYIIKIKYPPEAQSFLDSFVPGEDAGVSEDAAADTDGVQTEETETEDPRVQQLQEQNDTLESELEQMRAENAMILEALQDLGVDINQEQESEQG